MSITIRRGSLPSDHFTIVSNDWIRDESLTWGARGLLTWLASHTDDFNITEDVIVESGPSGRDAVRTMLQALEEAGYLRRVRTPIVAGGSTVDYILQDPRGSENPTLGNVGKSDPRADQEEDGLFPVPPSVGKSDPRSYREDQKKTKTPSVSTRTKLARRVPDDFKPTDEMKKWWNDNGMGTVLDAWGEHEKFMDYWRAASGQRATKHDWAATWRNWMRRAYEEAGARRPGAALAPTSGAPYRPSTTDQKVAQTLELGRRLQAMEDAK